MLGVQRKLRRPSSVVKTARSTLSLVLKAAEVACNGLPIPGVQGSITALLAVLRSFERDIRNEATLGELTKQVGYVLSEVIIPAQSVLNDAALGTGSAFELALENLSAYVDSPYGRSVRWLISLRDLNEALEPWGTRRKQGILKRLFNVEHCEEDLQTLRAGVKRALERYQVSTT